MEINDKQDEVRVANGDTWQRKTQVSTSIAGEYSAGLWQKNVAGRKAIMIHLRISPRHSFSFTIRRPAVVSIAINSDSQTLHHCSIFSFSVKFGRNILRASCQAVGAVNPLIPTLNRRRTDH